MQQHVDGEPIRSGQHARHAQVVRQVQRQQQQRDQDDRIIAAAAAGDNLLRHENAKQYREDKVCCSTDDGRQPEPIQHRHSPEHPGSDQDGEPSSRNRWATRPGCDGRQQEPGDGSHGKTDEHLVAVPEHHRRRNTRRSGHGDKPDTHDDDREQAAQQKERSERVREKSLESRGHAVKAVSPR